MWETGQEWKASPPLKRFLFCFWQIYRKRVWLLAWITEGRAESLPKTLRIRNWIHASKCRNDNSSMKYLLLSIIASWYSLCASWLLFIKINNWDYIYLAISSHIFAFFSSFFFFFGFGFHIANSQVVNNEDVSLVLLGFALLTIINNFHTAPHSSCLRELKRLHHYLHTTPTTAKFDLSLNTLLWHTQNPAVKYYWCQNPYFYRNPISSILWVFNF